MAVYRSSVGAQLSAYERHVDNFVRVSMNQGGQRIRSRMVKEQLSKPTEASRGVFGVRRRKGDLQRSLYTRPTKQGFVWALVAALGFGGIAPYAEEHEKRGRIRFLALVEQEFRVILDGIRTGLEFFGQRFGQAPTSTTEVAAPSSAASFGIQAVGRRILLQRAVRRERRLQNWSSMLRGS